MVNYEAFFIEQPLNSKLARNIEFKHITITYKPEQEHSYLYGIVGKFKVIGYGNDGQNEGLLVKLVSLSEDSLELTGLYNAVAVPHITLSVSVDGKPVNTGKLTFDKEIPEEFKDLDIYAKFGGFIGKPIYKR